MSLNHLLNDTNIDIKVLSITAGSSIISGNEKINGTLEVVGNTKLDSALEVVGITKLDSTLEVVGNTKLDSALEVVGITKLDSTLEVVGNTKLDSGLSLKSIPVDLAPSFALSYDSTTKDVASAIISSANIASSIVFRDPSKNIEANDLNLSGNLSVKSTVDSSSISTGAIVCDGGMGLAKKLCVGTGLYLPTSGGTASELNYYEELSTPVTWIGAIPDTAGTIFLRRIGKIVIADLSKISAVANAASSIGAAAGTIPARFAPQATQDTIGRVIDNGVGASGQFSFISDGGILIYASANTTAFAGAGVTGFGAITFSWSKA